MRRAGWSTVHPGEGQRPCPLEWTGFPIWMGEQQQRSSSSRLPFFWSCLTQVIVCILSHFFLTCSGTCTRYGRCVGFGCMKLWGRWRVLMDPPSLDSCMDGGRSFTSSICVCVCREEAIFCGVNAKRQGVKTRCTSGKKKKTAVQPGLADYRRHQQPKRGYTGE